jgi:serine protease
MVRAYSTYSGVTLVADYAVTSGDPYLTNGVVVTNISGASGSEQYWRLAVPSGMTQVVFTISGGTGDADMYVRFGSRPTTTTYSCRPYLSGNNETCTISNPSAGDWYVLLRGYTAFSGVSLRGQY